VRRTAKGFRLAESAQVRKSVLAGGRYYLLYVLTSAFIRLDDLRESLIVDLPVISITLARTPVAQPTCRRRRISGERRHRPFRGAHGRASETASPHTGFTTRHWTSRELVKSATS